MGWRVFCGLLSPQIHLTQAHLKNTYLCMRTTIDMPDGLFKRAKKAAAERHTTLRMLMVDALERSLNEPPSGSFRLQDAAVGYGAEKVDAAAINQAIDEQREGPLSY